MQTDMTLSQFGGICPNVGDKIFLDWRDWGFLRVEERHFVLLNNVERGWALLVSEFMGSPYEKALLGRWAADSAFLAEPVEEEPKLESLSERKQPLDRKSRDPAYWTEERKAALAKERARRLRDR